MNKIHYGSYLICRFITEPYQIMAPILLVKDESGAKDLSIYNYHSDTRFKIECKLDEIAASMHDDCL